MRQTGSIFKVLKDTTWPDRKQRWHDFISVLEYTAFFTVIIYAFDELLSRAMSALINFSKENIKEWACLLFFVIINADKSENKGLQAFLLRFELKHRHSFTFNACASNIDGHV